MLRLLARGARPGRAIVAGQGLDAIRRSTTRTGEYHRVLTALVEGRDPGPGPADWITRSGGDPLALRHVLGTHVATDEAILRAVTTPTLVAVGAADHGHATADELAGLLPHGEFARVPGDHLTAWSSPEFTAATARFLAQA
ncbi:hypothetical protein VA596_49755 [Amycolatopsis sp., V23-08]|uniref:Alpha/beta hydrolase n=1 Tax=Amycolatopsis heterodermiae TaxID=3110235 RepID=A0ABU5RN10_9PSEU|nr:hypothetical protein [Amycolatopsis sp., V23-08]MEA5367696.1 hypothetical protein [Amycolatopsis sp., V23-08]